MQTVTLELSTVELRTMREALADYAVTSFRAAREISKMEAYPRLTSDWLLREQAACKLLGALPAVRA
jgi:hypothetical protein